MENLAKNLQIPHSVEECIYLMRSYIYIDKFTCEVHIREITPALAPGFILGVCAQIPFLYSYVKPYIKGKGVRIEHIFYRILIVISSMFLEKRCVYKMLYAFFFFEDVMRGQVYEVAISDQYKQEMMRNEFINTQLLYYNYTPVR